MERSDRPGMSGNAAIAGQPLHPLLVVSLSASWWGLAADLPFREATGPFWARAWARFPGVGVALGVLAGGDRVGRVPCHQPCPLAAGRMIRDKSDASVIDRHRYRGVRIGGYLFYDREQVNAI